MARYTRMLCDVLNDLCGGRYNPMNYSDMPKIINESWENVFAQTFEIWDEEYREILCKKILVHYYTQEIGAETPMLFIFRMNRKMDEIMPYYNILYRTIIKEIEGVIGIDISEEYKERAHGDSKNVENERREESKSDDTTRESVSGAQESERENSAEESTSQNKSAQNEEATSQQRGTVRMENTGTQENSKNETSTQTYNSEMEHQLGHSETMEYNTNNQRNGADTQNDISDNMQKFQDTPQGSIDNLKAGKYLANATINNGTYESKMQYGSGEKKTGTDVRHLTGSDTDVHKGNDENVVAGKDVRTDNLSQNEERNLTDTNNSDITSVSDEKGSRKEGREKSSERNEKSRTTDEYISNMLAKAGKEGAENHRDNKVYTRRTRGRNTGDWIGQIMAWRESIINIDMLIIKDLESQFMGLW